MPLVATITKSATFTSIAIGFLIGAVMLTDRQIDTRIKLLHYGMKLPSYPIISLAFQILSPDNMGYIHFSPEIPAGRSGSVISQDILVPSPLSISVFPEGESEIADLRLRIYYPESAEKKQLKTLIYFHGGGLVAGNVSERASDHLCWKFAERGFFVISVDYRLAPAHPLPASLDDSVGVIIWAWEHQHAVLQAHSDKNNIALLGDSSGAYLVAAASQYIASTRPDVKVVHQVLVSPDLRHYSMTSSSKSLYAHGYLMWHTLAQTYYQKQDSPKFGEQFNATILAHPLQNKRVDKLSSVEIILSQYDYFHDDGKLYYDLLKNSNIPVTIRTYNTTVHGFLTYDFLKSSHQAFLDISHNLEQILDIKQ